MTTKREQIMSAIKDALNAENKPVGVPAVERVRVLGSTQPEMPLMIVYPVKEYITRKGPVSVRSFTVRVDCRASSTVSDEVSIDTHVDEMLAWATEALAGNRLDGLVHDIAEESVDWQIESADYTYVVATVDFNIQYQTLVADQSQG